jgi:AbrB family looped-hinge helix DNA binding protein
MTHFCNVFSSLEEEASFDRAGETVFRRWRFNGTLAQQLVRRLYYVLLIDHRLTYEYTSYMETFRTVISSKGQVVVPAELRQRLGLEKGTRATWKEEEGRLILTPITERILDEIQGFLKPRPGEPSMFEEHFKEREREREREGVKKP